MNPQDVKTRMRAGGLRYESKAGGTDFPGAFGATMSCLRCGRHVPRSRLVSFNLAGRQQFRCGDGCAGTAVATAATPAATP